VVIQWLRVELREVLRGLGGHSMVEGKVLRVLEIFEWLFKDCSKVFKDCSKIVSMVTLDLEFGTWNLRLGI
jgi:hypothetical protein